MVGVGCDREIGNGGGLVKAIERGDEVKSCNYAIFAGTAVDGLEGEPYGVFQPFHRIDAAGKVVVGWNDAPTGFREGPFALVMVPSFDVG